MAGFSSSRDVAWQPAVVRYEITHKLAEGGMAELFLARELGVALFEKWVVIKRILPTLASDDSFVAMLTNEARILAQLNHPNIVHVYELGRQQGDLYMVLEFVDGADLRRILQRFAELERLVPRGFACRVVADVLAGLQHAHALQDLKGQPLGLVHRDVSPPNVMVSYEGGIKLLDFGIAKSSLNVTQVRQLKGKFAYMSPEQVQMHPVDGRSDLFAAGVILWEMLAGQPLFKHDTVEGTIRAILKDPIPRLRERDLSIPDELDAIVRRALAKSPDARYPSAEAMRHDLEHLIREERWEADSLSMRRIMRELFGDPLPRPQPKLTESATIILYRGSVEQTFVPGLEEGPPTPTASGEFVSPPPTETATTTLQDLPGALPVTLPSELPTVVTEGTLRTPERSSRAARLAGRTGRLMIGVAVVLFSISLALTYALLTLGHTRLR